ncbi:MAG: hypothetical protein JXA21_11135, partial [Anaerolineae bacterium]|nr:hypothetical protein [Anaerolineae bacterium]
FVGGLRPPTKNLPSIFAISGNFEAETNFRIDTKVYQKPHFCTLRFYAEQRAKCQRSLEPSRKAGSNRGRSHEKHFGHTIQKAGNDSQKRRRF